MKIINCLTVVGFLLSLSTNAQDTLKGKPYASLKLGTLGIGLEYSHPISPRWSARLNASFLNLKMHKESESGSIITVKDTKINLGAVGLVGDFNLSKTNPNWKLCVGVVYQMNKISENRAYTYSSSDLTEDLGSLSLKFTAMPVNPYVGLMVGNFRSQKKLQFSIEAGTLYHGAPRVEFTGTGRIAGTAEQKDKVEANVKNYSFFPVGYINVRYVLGKK